MAGRRQGRQRRRHVDPHGARTVAGQASAQGKKVSKAATDRGDASLLDSAIDAVERRQPGSGKPYEQWTKAELLERAQELDIEGRSGLNKKQLIAALRGRMRHRSATWAGSARLRDGSDRSRLSGDRDRRRWPCRPRADGSPHPPSERPERASADSDRYAACSETPR